MWKWSHNRLWAKQCMHCWVLEVYKLLQGKLQLTDWKEKCIFCCLTSFFFQKLRVVHLLHAFRLSPDKHCNWLKIWSMLHLGRNWYLGKRFMLPWSLRFCYWKRLSWNKCDYKWTEDRIAYKEDTRFSASATKKPGKQNICVTFLLDSLSLCLTDEARQFQPMFWHTLIHHRQAT